MSDTEVYEAYVAKTKRFYQVHCRSDWEDCLHTGFVPFWAAYKSGGLEDLLGYAFGVAKNVVHNYGRSRCRHRRRDVAITEVHGVAPQDEGRLGRHVSDRFPQAMLRFKQVASPVEYESFRRFYVLEQSFEQAHTEMGITALHFKNSKYKAVRKFSKIMRTILAAEC